MKRKLLLLFLFLVITPNLFAQMLKITLDVKWEITDSIIRKQTGLDSCAYLEIKYLNKSSTPIYFLKISNEVKNIPCFINTFIVEKNKSVIIDRYRNHYNTGHYNILLYNFDNPTLYLTCWDVFPDSVDYNKEQELSIINDILGNIYYLIYDSLYIQRKYELSILSKKYFIPEIKECDVLTKFNNRFAFFNEGESYVERYNLIGFNVLGGTYAFKFYNNKIISNYVFTSYGNNYKDDMPISNKLILPQKVGKFILYTGEFYSNELILNF